MTFNSLPYAVFLAVVVGLYRQAGHRAQNLGLLLASYVFYGWWDVRFLTLVVTSTVVDFLVAQQVHRAEGPSRKRWLGVSLAMNLGLLGFFKYAGFFAGTFATAMQSVGWSPGAVTLNIVLPVGISFYTFQTLAYTIDVYRGDLEPTDDWVDFALYVSFFPQLVAGPIERASTLMPQLQSPRRPTHEDVRVGLTLLLIGLVRKVGIADAVAGSVDRLFANPAHASSSELWLGMYLFALQIYGDFAGYSSMARGSARLLGIRLMRNFDQPYLATSISDFWRRWHRSLSFWLRDYLYIPLGGNRAGSGRTYLNLLITMLLGGLWHGANWTFVVWGGLHGLALAVHRMGRGEHRHASPQGLSRWVAIGVTFHVVAVVWVFFRAPTFGVAWTYGAALLYNPWTLGHEAELLWRVAVFGTATLVLDVIQSRARSHTPMLAWSQPVRVVALAGALLFLLVFGALDVEVPFLYFQF